MGKPGLCCLAAYLFPTLLVAQETSRLVLARTQVAAGQKFQQEGFLDRAEASFRQALKIMPELPAAYLGLGRVFCLAKRFSEAISVLEEAQVRYTRWQQNRALAELETRQEAKDRARQFADLMRLQQGKTPATAAGGRPTGGFSPMINLTRARMATEEFLASRRWQAETAAAIPAEVFYLLGLARLRTGDMAAGMQNLLICTALDSKHGLAHYNLAVVYLAEGDPWAAKESLDRTKALGVSPHPQFVKDLERALAQAAPVPRD